MKDAINKISKIAQFLNPIPSYNKEVFLGLFSYEESEFNTDLVLKILQDCTNGQPHGVVNCLSLGKDYFVQYCPTPPSGQFPQWHAYQLKNQASAYFIHNVVDDLFPNWASAINLAIK